MELHPPQSDTSIVLGFWLWPAELELCMTATPISRPAQWGRVAQLLIQQARRCSKTLQQWFTRGEPDRNECYIVKKCIYCAMGQKGRSAGRLWVDLPPMVTRCFGLVGLGYGVSRGQCAPGVVDMKVLYHLAVNGDHAEALGLGI